MNERHVASLGLRAGVLAAAAGLLASCSAGTEADSSEQSSPPPSAAAPTPGDAPSSQPAAAWDLASSGEGDALIYPASGDTAVRLFCLAATGQILVNVPAFRPIGSEERLSFGSGGEVHALVADTRGDRLRGGVSGVGAVPADLAALIAGPVSVSYGAQTSGPHPAPPRDLARAFTVACNDGPPAATPTASQTDSPKPGPKPGSMPGQVGACLMQGDQRLTNPPLRAVGTEPFWGARIEGRCVSYSHPDDQQGTRVWTRYTATPDGGAWTGTLEGRPFVLRTRSQPGCSDGMSDRRYPIAVELTVGGEQRRGCAERR